LGTGRVYPQVGSGRVTEFTVLGESGWVESSVCVWVESSGSDLFALLLRCIVFYRYV